MTYRTTDLNTGWHVTRTMRTQGSFRNRKLLAPMLMSIMAFLKSKSVTITFSINISVISQNKSERADYSFLISAKDAFYFKLILEFIFS
jgi:hypothetical protein